MAEAMRKETWPFMVGFVGVGALYVNLLLIYCTSCWRLFASRCDQVLQAPHFCLWYQPSPHSLTRASCALPAHLSHLRFAVVLSAYSLMSHFAVDDAKKGSQYCQRVRLLGRDTTICFCIEIVVDVVSEFFYCFYFAPAIVIHAIF